MAQNDATSLYLDFILIVQDRGPEAATISENARWRVVSSEWPCYFERLSLTSGNVTDKRESQIFTCTSTNKVQENNC